MDIRKWTFRKQFIISLMLFIGCSVLAAVLQEGRLQNVAWILYGIFFVIHPVWPKAMDHLDPKKLTTGCRIAGLLCVFVGLITKFNVQG